MLTTSDTSPCPSVTWEPTGDGRRVISLADNHLLLWDLQESSSQAVVSSQIMVFISLNFLTWIFWLNSEYSS